MSVAIALCFRMALATVFLLSAGWKVAHGREFRTAALGIAPRGLRSLSIRIRLPLAALEVLVAGCLVVGGYTSHERWVHAAGSVAAIVALVVFSIAIAQARHLEHCGCWASPSITDASRLRRLTLVRNGVLLALAFGTIVLSSAPSISLLSHGAPTIAGILLGLVLLQLPEIVAIATLDRTIALRRNLN